MLLYHGREIQITPDEIIDYLRKSQSDDPLLTVEEVLANHERILDEWSERHLGAVVPQKNKFREVVSGETLKDRPEITRILRMIESPHYKAIKVVDPQRLTRGDLEDMGKIMKILKLTNTLIITPDRIYDLHDEYDWEAFERELKRGNDYLKYVKKRLLAGRLLSVSAGNYIGSIPPYGYNKTTVMVGRKECPTLIENPEEADVVRMIFDMYVNKDMGRPSICRYLDSMAIKPPKGKYWSESYLKDLLQNVHYLGKVKWNWRKTVSVIQEGEVINTRPKSKIGEFWIYEGRHEAIVSEDLFDAAQEKQKRNHRAKTKTKIRNPLAGLLYCSCGRAMSFRTYQSHKSRPRLLCDGQVHCRTGSCLYDEMIDRVCEILEKCIEEFEVRVEEDTGDSVKLHAKLIKDLERKMESLQAQELAQWELQSHPDPAQRMPAHIFKMLNEKVLREKEEVQQALCKAYESMPEPVDYEEKIVTFKAARDALRDPTATAEKQNKLLKACIERIEYNRSAPQRLKRDPAKPKGAQFDKAGGHWSNPPFELNINLRV